MVIRIDHGKCIGAKECGVCMKVCPMGVFMNLPLGRFNPKERPTKFRVVPFFKDICTGCSICSDSCPKKCITVKV